MAKSYGTYRFKIDRNEYPQLQKSIKMDIDANSVRLDVYIEDEKEVVYKGTVYL